MMRSGFREFGVAAMAAAMMAAGASAQTEHRDRHGAHDEEGGITYHPHSPHHVSILLAGTRVRAEDHTGFTIGGDYEYRVNRRLGVGGVVEHAFGEVDATTVLAVADIHLWRGLAAQIGPGVEFLDDRAEAVGRIGALYEIDLGDRFTISPQLHYDITAEDSIVFGMAFGRSF